MNKAYNARDDTTWLSVNNFITEITNCKDLLMNLLQIEDHNMLKQMFAGFLQNKNHTDGSGASNTMSSTASYNAEEKPIVKKKKRVPLRLDADADG